MQSMKAKIFSGVAAASILASAFAPVAYADDLLISGNGNESTNVIHNTQTSTVAVEQNASTNASVTVSAESSTGGNSADKNTGDGGVTIDTGNATVTVTTTVIGGTNEASINACGCPNEPLTADISGNGNKSTNAIHNTDTNVVATSQRARTRARVRVKKAKAKTGYNSADRNTGDGTVEVTTGNAETTVDTTIEGGSNTLNP